MNISFKSAKDEKMANNKAQLDKKYGSQAKAIGNRLVQLKASANMKQFGFDTPHSLEGNYKHCIGIDLIQPYRIIVKPVGEFDLANRETITELEVQELYIDYH